MQVGLSLSWNLSGVLGGVGGVGGVVVRCISLLCLGWIALLALSLSLFLLRRRPASPFNSWISGLYLFLLRLLLSEDSKVVR